MNANETTGLIADLLRDALTNKDNLPPALQNVDCTEASVVEIDGGGDCHTVELTIDGRSYGVDIYSNDEPEPVENEGSAAAAESEYDAEIQDFIDNGVEDAEPSAIEEETTLRDGEEDEEVTLEDVTGPKDKEDKVQSVPESLKK